VNLTGSARGASPTQSRTPGTSAAPGRFLR
jgi:hypothetical protein